MCATHIENLTKDMMKKRDFLKQHEYRNKYFQHVAVIFKGNIKRNFDVMSFGMNFKMEQPYVRTIHAEANALNKLPLRNNKKLKPIHLCVIKTSKTGKLGNSKPCFHCISKLLEDAPKKGYRVEWIFYSKESGEIEKCKLNRFLETQGIFLSSYYKSQMGIDR